MSAGQPHAVEPPLPPEKPPVQKSSRVMIIVVVLGMLLLGMLLCGGLLVALLLPAVTAARSAAQRVASSNNLKTIGMALHSYHDQHDAFPPAYTTDENGEPLLSWRVLILPYMQQSILYEQFHLDEPWDSPHNMSLLKFMPPMYESPRYDASEDSTDTNYVAVRAENSVFPDARSITIADVSDGTVTTVAVVEMQETGIPWTRPEDVTPQQAYAAFASGGRTEGSNLLMTDGSVRYVDGSLSQETFDAMVTRNGREEVSF